MLTIDPNLTAMYTTDVNLADANDLCNVGLAHFALVLKAKLDLLARKFRHSIFGTGFGGSKRWVRPVSLNVTPKGSRVDSSHLRFTDAETFSDVGSLHRTTKGNTFFDLLFRQFRRIYSLTMAVATGFHRVLFVIEVSTTRQVLLFAAPPIVAGVPNNLKVGRFALVDSEDQPMGFSSLPLDKDPAIPVSVWWRGPHTALLAVHQWALWWADKAQNPLNILFAQNDTVDGHALILYHEPPVAI